MVFGEAANITSVPTATPKLVLLPGMDGTGELFDSFVKALPQSFTTEIVRYPPNRCLTSSELLHLVDSNAFGSEPFVLIAESFSSPLAIQWAATNPLNLKGLVISAPDSRPVRYVGRFDQSSGSCRPSVSSSRPLRVQSSYCSLGAMRHPRWWLL